MRYGAKKALDGIEPRRAQRTRSSGSSARQFGQDHAAQVHQPHDRRRTRRQRQGPGARRRRRTSFKCRTSTSCGAGSAWWRRCRSACRCRSTTTWRSRPRMAGLRDRAELDALVERCLRQAALWDEVKDRLGPGTKLSGGQQQRLTIARALSHDRRSCASTSSRSRSIRSRRCGSRTCSRSSKQRMTIILVTNLVQQARRLADQVAFLNDGAAGRGRADRRHLLRAPGATG